LVDIDLWAQQLTNYLQEHMDTEREALRSYAHLAEETKSDRVRFLIQMVIDDEVRHHRLFQDMIHWMRSEHSGREDIESRIGTKAAVGVGDEREHLVELTDQLLKMEQDDERELKELERIVTEVVDTAWWSSLVEAMRLDTRKHIMLMEAIKKLASE
jgi:rubrerythrin